MWVSDDLELTPDPMLNPSAWSNWTRVHPGREEVTIDFATLDPANANLGTLIVRLALPLGAAFDLRDALIEVMAAYTGRGQHPLED